MKALWKCRIIAESDDTIIIEGHRYFPREAISKGFFLESQTHTIVHGRELHHTIQ